MKHLRLIALALVIALQGCLKVDETLTIEKNGSGNLDVLYSVSEQTIAQMKSMFKLRDQMAAVTGDDAPQTMEDRFQQIFFDPSEAQIRALFKKYESLGIQVETLKVDTRNATRTVNLKITFSDLAKVGRADFFPHHGFSLTHNSDGTYTFFRSPESDSFLRPQDVGADSGLLSSVLTGFRVAIKVTTPGKVLETNASRRTLYNSAWIFDYDKDPKAVTALQNQKMKIIFDGNGINLPELRQLTKAVSVAPVRKSASKR